jgi:CheY-like chemotaxis protein
MFPGCAPLPEGRCGIAARPGTLLVRRLYVEGWQKRRNSCARHGSLETGPSMSEQIAGQPTILVVDDDQGILALLRDIFEDVNFDVRLAGTLAEAQGVLAGPDKIDIVLTDVLLPDGSGETLCQTASAGGIPCILMSGHPNTIARLQQGPVDFVAKPFRIDDVLRAVLMRLPP